MRQRWTSTTASLALVCGVLAACSGDGDAGNGSGSSAAPPAATTAPSQSASASSSSGAATGGESPSPVVEPREDPEAFSVEPTVESRDGEPITLVGVSIDEESGVDRLVITTDGSEVPGWTAQYVDVVRVDGEPVLVDGSAFLELSLRPADPNGDEGLAPEVTEELTGAGAIRQVSFARYVDRTVTFAIGMDEERPFRIVTDEDAVILELER